MIAPTTIEGNDGTGFESIDMAAVTERLGTPVLCFALDRVRRNAKALKALAPPPFKLFFSLKACYLLPVVKVLLDEGFGLEACSPHELALARYAGASGSVTRLHALCPDVAEASEACDAGLEQLTLGSFAGAERVGIAAAARRIKVPVALRIAGRSTGVNPYLAAGGRLGFAIDGDGELDAAVAMLAQCPWVDLVGLHSHSQIAAITIDGHQEVAASLLALGSELSRRHRLKFRELGLGGGFARAASFCAGLADFEGLLRMVRSAWGPQAEASFEPGRYLVEDAAVAVTKVLGLHGSHSDRWCFVDMPSNALMPFDGRRYPARPWRPRPGVPQSFGIGDTLSTFTGVLDPEALMPPPGNGDLLLLTEAGSYTVSTMQYFMRGAPQIACFDDGRLCWTRDSESAEEWAAKWRGEAVDER